MYHRKQINKDNQENQQIIYHSEIPRLVKIFLGHMFKKNQEVSDNTPPLKYSYNL